jgi:HEAT repeat protein
MRIGNWQLSLLALMLLGATSWAQEGGKKKDFTPKIPIKSLKSWIMDLKDKDASVRDIALSAIPNYGSSTSEAIPAVIDRCLDPDAGVRVKAVMALSVLEILDKDIARTVDTLAKRAQEDPQAQVRYLAINALQRFDPVDARRTIAALVEASKYQNSYEVRRIALIALVKFGMDKTTGPDTKAVTAALVALKDPAIPVRYAAITAIALLGKPNNPVVSAGVEKALTDLANGTDKIFAIWAKVGLANQDVLSTATHVKFISQMLKQSDLQVKLEAMRAISVIGALAKPTVPDLIDLLEDKDNFVVFNACLTLGSLNVEAREAKEPLTKLIAKKDVIEPVKQAATNALESLKGITPKPMPKTP